MLAFLLTKACCGNKLIEEFSWNELDYVFSKASERQNAIETGIYIPGAAIPTGIEVWNNRMFIATPRIFPGVPSTLSQISISGIFYFLNKIVYCRKSMNTKIILKLKKRDLYGY